MESIFALLLLSFLFVSNVSAEVISLVSDDEICLEATVTFTCMVNGTDLGWRYGGSSDNTRFYLSPSGSNTLAALGSSPFSTRITSVSGGIITSIATTSNLTRDANGLTLECSNGLFDPGVEIISVELNLGGFITPIQFILSNSVKSIFILPNECNSVRRAEVSNQTGVIETITSSSALLSFTPPGPGLYIFNVSNLGSNGQIIASDSFNFNWNTFNFAVDGNIYYNISSTIILITIRVPPINQPEMLTCELSLMRYSNSYTPSTPCLHNKVLNFTNVPVGSYTYVVTITNARGSSSRSGNVLVEEIVSPTGTTPSPTMVSSSSEFFSSLPSLSSSSIPTSTSPPSEQKNTTTTIALAIALGLSGLWCVLSILWCILHLCWRHCFCCLTLWTLSIWRYVFCECFRKESKSDANIVPKDESNL